MLNKSQALDKSTIQRYSGLPNVICLSTNPCNMEMLSLVILPLVNPPLNRSPLSYAVATKFSLLFTAVSKKIVNTDSTVIPR